MRKAHHLFYVLFLVSCFVNPVFPAPLGLKSPNGKLEILVGIKSSGSLKDATFYCVNFMGRTVMDDSLLGLELKEGALVENFKIEGQESSSNDTVWKSPFSERSEIRDRYNQLVIHLVNKDGRRLDVTFRAYDEGAAFFYSLPAQGGMADFTMTRERTQFSFDKDYETWAVYHAQGNYDATDPRDGKQEGRGQTKLSLVRAGAERPLTVKLDEKLYAAVTEAKLVDYARMKLRPVSGMQNAFEAFLDAEKNVYGEVAGKTPFATPWRVIMIATSPGELLEQNYLILNLNDPCAIGDTSWIKPGKQIRCCPLTTVEGKKHVDFAVTHGLQYVMFDAGWYGKEHDPKSDARGVQQDPNLKPTPSILNMREIVDYANSKGIGIILYVNHIALEKQADELFPLYQKWGVKGVKFGFVNVGSQRWTSLVHEWVRKAADHKLVVDIHDELRSTGYERTYPNLLTVEGVWGNEEFPTAIHNAALPFTRFLTGAADYTFCWMSSKLKVTKAHQLAVSTIYFGALQTLYWYDGPNNVKDEPALDYWKLLPTTWDETRVLQGEIGRRVSVARRKGREWYVGAISPVDGEFVLKLEFLPSEQKYRAEIYTDTDDLKGVKFEQISVDAQAALPLKIAPNGGVAIRIIPEN